MIVKAKIYGDEVTIKDGVAYSSNKFLEEICNFIAKTIGLGGASYKGYLPKLAETFGKDFRVLEVEDEPKGAIY